MRIVANNGDGSAEPAVLAAAVAAVRAYVAGQDDSAHRRPAGRITAWRAAMRAASRSRRSWRLPDRYRNPTIST